MRKATESINNKSELLVIIRITSAKQFEAASFLGPGWVQDGSRISGNQPVNYNSSQMRVEGILIG